MATVPQTPNPDSNPDIHQAASTETTQDNPNSNPSNIASSNPEPNNPASPPINQNASVDTLDNLATKEKSNQVPLSNDVQPRSIPVNEEGIVKSTDPPISFQAEPQDSSASSQVPQELQDMFKQFEDRTTKEVQVFEYSEETKKADIRIKDYSARQTEQVITSNPKITSIGRDDFRQLIRVGTDPSPIRDKYCFDVNGNRVEYFD